MEKSKLLSDIEIMGEVLERVEEIISPDVKKEINILFAELLNLLKKVIIRLDKDEDMGGMVHNAKLCAMNLEWSIQRFIRSDSNYICIFKYEIMELFRKLKALTEYQYLIMTSEDNITKHWGKVYSDLVQLHRESKREYKYKVSIILYAYNQLEYTKIAIESIYKYIDFSKGDVELITVNNGSTDDTELFFESLPNEKKINHRYNIKGVADTALLTEGEFVLGFSNDAVATPRFLEQLLKCIESSPNIAAVVPTCNEDAIANKQGISIPYENDISCISQIEIFADKYNKTNSMMWEEYNRIMPFVCIYRKSVLDIGILDPIYTEIQFIDDDFSTLLRRTGWKCIVAKDTFLHHFGSITFKADAMKYNYSLSSMRKVYWNKWGVDAWESRGGFLGNYPCDSIVSEKVYKILWIEPMYGEAFLEVKNKLKRQVSGIIISSAIILNDNYRQDAENLFDECIYGDGLNKTLEELEEQYDYIGMGAYINEITTGSVIDILELLYNKLTMDGKMIIPLRNCCSFLDLMELIANNGIYKLGRETDTYGMLSMRNVVKMLENHKYLNNYKIYYIADGQLELEGYKQAFVDLKKIMMPYISEEVLNVEMSISMAYVEIKK